MKKKILCFLGGAALLFGMIACSEDDDVNSVGAASGADAASGVNGLNGANGSSCEVVSLKDDTGYKILCGGDSVGVLLNGKTGATGKKGVVGPDSVRAGETEKASDTGKTSETAKVDESCTATEVANGVKVTCGNTNTVLKNKSCTVVDTTAKDGEKGLRVSCDDGTSGTIWNGNDGAGCVSQDNEDGTVSVTCADGNTVKLYKAMCGADAYDPEEKFCVLGKLYDKCGGKAYIVNREYCKDGVVEELCTEVNRKEDGSYEVVANRALSEDEFCLAGIVTKKCGSKEFSMNEFCGKTMDGKVDSILTFCKNPDDERLESAYQLIGKSIFPTDEDDAAFSSSSLFGNLIGPKLDDFTGDDLKKFYDALENLKTSCEEIP